MPAGPCCFVAQAQASQPRHQKAFMKRSSEYILVLGWAGLGGGGGRELLQESPPPAPDIWGLLAQIGSIYVNQPRGHPQTGQWAPGRGCAHGILGNVHAKSKGLWEHRATLWCPTWGSRNSWERGGREVAGRQRTWSGVPGLLCLGRETARKMHLPFAAFRLTSPPALLPSVGVP